MPTALINDAFVPLAEARVSVLDRGFLFADSVYEVIPVYAGQPFRLGNHLQRLQTSLDGLRIPNPHPIDGWTQRIHDLIEANGGGDIAVYLQITRGASPRRDHRLPDDLQPTVVAFCQSRPAPDETILRRGIPAITTEDIRWLHCRIKSTSLLANIMAADSARQEGAAEAILVRDGAVLEGTSSNVFAVSRGQLVTPALRETILAGITRGVILEIARREGLEHAELEVMTPDDLRQADEIWITSSTREIHAVTQLDGAIVGTGVPGPLWTRMRSWLQASAHE